MVVLTKIIPITRPLITARKRFELDFCRDFSYNKHELLWLLFAAKAFLENAYALRGCIRIFSFYSLFEIFQFECNS